MQQKKGSWLSVFKNIYHDEFQWSLVKSVGAFILGVRIAKELVGLEVMPAIQA
ncbi:CLUMA_CG018275, isoform A [Clunio marinus]|uniref:CLUMA_CG018275, isoform A n=1 Tax=Clunio marinus TaxID=568069 RepID=A0A1J1IYJ6_9DIPT|nr:CLUMA_CG018275, isoform A [Clunio marinus]